MGEIKELSNQLQVFQREVEGLKGSLHKETERQTATGLLEVQPSNDNGHTTVELTPITPKARVLSPFSITEPSSSALTIVSTTSPMLGCVTIMLSGHIMAQFFPGRPLKMLAYGCTAGVSCLAFWRTRPAGTSFLTELLRIQTAVFGHRKQQ
jgi:hypothetical protein